MKNQCFIAGDSQASQSTFEEVAEQAKAWAGWSDPAQRKGIFELLDLEVELISRHQFVVTGTIPLPEEPDALPRQTSQGPDSRSPAGSGIGIPTTP